MTNFETELEKSGYIVFTNKGISMMPLLRQDRDLMVIHAKKDPLKKNDAVLFKRANGAYVLHRIIKVYGNGDYLICGDNCPFGEHIREECIIGILTAVVRDGKRISVDDPSYLRYLKKVPIRRFFLKLQAFRFRVLGKIKRLRLGRKKQ